MREAFSALVVVPVFAAMTGCASTTACPSDRVCGNSTWYTASGGQSIEGRVVVAPLTGVSGGGSDGAEAITLGARPVFLRFDLRGIDENVERAVLTLAPSPSWHPSGATRIVARGLSSDWNTLSSGAGLRPDPAGDVTLPGRSRTPVRIDVTEAVRAWRNGASDFTGVALTAEGAPVSFAGLGIETVASRPRLEVVLR